MAVEVPIEKDIKPIVYLSSALINIDSSNKEISSSNDYFVQLLSQLVKDIGRVSNIDVIVKLPESNQSNDQEKVLTEIYEHIEKYSALIISPVNEDNMWLSLRNHIKDLSVYKKMPVITIDKLISKPVNNILIPSISSDWENGGRCAANTVIEYLDSKRFNGQCINLLIIPGLEGSEPRIKGLQSEINKSKYDSIIKPHRVPQGKLDFTREKAKEAVIDYFKTEHNKYDFIFACNDEMALGARDAILEMDNPLIKEAKVVGFDGTKEFVAAMKSETNEILLSTVDVQLRKQVDKLVENILRLISQDHSFEDLSEFCAMQEFIAVKALHLYK